MNEGHITLGIKKLWLSSQDTLVLTVDKQTREIYGLHAGDHVQVYLQRILPTPTKDKEMPITMASSGIGNEEHKTRLFQKKREEKQ